METPAYQYQPLLPGDIRLVRLHAPESASDDGSSSSDFDPHGRELKIDFTLGKLESCHYSALSYAWGAGERSEALRVVGNDGVTALKITDNLRVALLNLRETESRILWIDQLCINQDDEVEKGNEVKRMSDIYAGAAKVVIWLGPSLDDDHLAMRFITSLSVREIDRLAVSEDMKPTWSALASLLRKPWFGRRWIIQEVAFAQRAELRCGHNAVAWPRFAEAVTLFASKLEAINPMFRVQRHTEISKTQRRVQKVAKYVVPVLGVVGAFAVGFVTRGAVKPQYMAPGLTSWSNDWGREMDETWTVTNDEYPIGQVHGVGAHSLVTTLDLIVRKRPGQRELERLCTLEGLLSYLPAFQCGQPQDVVFAVAALAKDAPQTVPAYGDDKQAVSICKQVVRSILLGSRSLNVICRSWAPALPDLPTWVPQLSRYPFELGSLAPGSGGVYVRKGPDPLVGHPGRCPYRASGASKAEAEFRSVGGRDVLAAHGFRVGRVERLFEAADGGVIPRSWAIHNGRDIMKPTAGDGSDDGDDADDAVKETFWRMLVCDRDKEGASAPSWMRRACEEAYGDAPTEPLDTEAVLRAHEGEPRAQSSSGRDFLRRVQASTWGRRMARLTAGGRGSLGLVPGGAMVGDEVCVLLGCDVPVVLRRRGSGLFEFVDEAYVHGIMDGEAVGCVPQEEFSLI